jgi:hypothetical protein
MTRSVTLHLDEFGKLAFERFTTSRGGSADAAVRTACLYYLADRGSPTADPHDRLGARGDLRQGLQVVQRCVSGLTTRRGPPSLKRPGSRG